MEIGASAQIAAFAILAFISVAGALGMTTTMSMFRSAIFLMASFIGVGGLFVLMMADLLGLLQVMMYIGGMLVMALFMVLFSGDPGGAMMAGMMELPLVERFFSLGLAHEIDHGDGGDRGHEHEGGGGGYGGGSEDGGDHEHGGGHQHGGEHGHGGGGQQEGDGAHENGEKHGPGGGEDGGDHEHGGGGHDMEPMFIVDQKKIAAVMAAVVWLALSAMILFRPAWPVIDEIPPQNSAERIGDLLMNKYMIAFEGAGLMILLGIFGAVYLSRPGRYPDPTARDEIQAAVSEAPAPIEEDPIEPLRPGAKKASASHEDEASA